MFSQAITSTAFTSDDADVLFQDKIGHFTMLGSDVSLVSTMRALIAPRMPDGRRLDIYNIQYPGSSTCVHDVVSQAYAALCNAFVIVDCRNANATDREATFENIGRNFTDTYDGYRELEIVEGFFARSFPVWCFVNDEQRTTMLIVQRLDARKLHYLQTALLVMMPWYHGSRETVSADELALIMSLKETTPDAYIACLNKLIQPYNLREVRTRRLLTGFETSLDRQCKLDTEAQLRSVDYDINDYQRYISDKLRERNELQIMLLGLETKIARTSEHDSELLNYVLRNNRVELREVAGNSITLEVFDYLSYYDEDMVERMIRDCRGAMYDVAPSDEAWEGMKKLMTKVFVDSELRIRVTAGYHITAGRGVNGVSGYGTDESFETHLPNPHIYEYACLGNYVTTFNTLIRDNDYVGIVETCLASVRSLNWGDSAVMNRFAHYMYDDSYRCVELPDGSVVYPSEAIKWIQDEEVRISQADALKAICFEEDDYEEIEEEEEFEDE